MDDRISEHYTVAGLAERILEAAGELSVDALAPVDAFHIRGRAATEELARLVPLAPGTSVLDVGCGLGGTSRYLASEYGCDVTGIDLTEEFCRAATILSERLGLNTRFRQASALDLPFDDASFDVVWTEHVQMNIAEKARFYGEIRRVLKPGGHFVFHDIFAGASKEMDFPVPWAGDPSISHLADFDSLDWSGFDRIDWEDKTAASIAFFEKVLGNAPGPLGLHLLQERRSFENVLANLRRGSVRVVQAVLVREAAA